MTADTVTSLVTEAIKLAMWISMPVLLAGMIIGLIISVFQSVTQIQEMTLTFIPKIAVVAIATLVAAPWMTNKLIAYTINLWYDFGRYV